MLKDITVPTVGESVSSGILTTWMKGNGEYVDREEELFELETDKATVSIPSPDSGILTIMVEENMEVEVGQVVGKIEAGASVDEEIQSDQASGVAVADADLAADGEAAVEVTAIGSPAARRIITQYELQPHEITGTGKGGRITKEDALRAVEQKRKKESTIRSKGIDVRQEEPQEAETMGVANTPAEIQRRVPMSNIRMRIAQRLVEAQQKTAHLTTFNEIDMSSVMESRALYRESFEKTHGVKLGFMSFFVKAACHALSAFPAVNAQIDGNDILYNHHFDIGVAVSTDKGLVVPVMRNAEVMEFAEIERLVVDLARRAREKKLKPDELTGGTFTITNGGVFGSLLSTPIINYPQTAILGMHAIQKRPVVVEEQIAIRPMMYVALSYDHRLVDGREAVSFLVKIKNLIEDPQRMLLGI